MKRFACVWLPAFRIDRLRRARPQAVPRDQPFALVESGARGVGLTAVNHAAAINGVHAGQMLADARAVLPGLLTGTGTPGRDARALEQLALWLGRYGPQRNHDGTDGLWVDITGVAHLFGGEAALARDCVARLARAGFTARLAIADTRSGAFALARYGCRDAPVAIAPPGGMRAALADLPVESLQLTGDLVVLLRRLGLKRVGQLYDLPRDALARRFRTGAPKTARGGGRRRSFVGPAVTCAGWAEALVMRLDQALGDLGEPARGMAEPPQYRVQRAYAEPLISHEGVLAALDDLAGQLCATLEARDAGARALKCALCRADGTVAEVMVRTARPARGVRHITALFEARLERVDVGLGLDAVVLEALHTEQLARTQAGFVSGSDGAGMADDGARAGPDVRVAQLVDRLSNRLGSRAVFHLEPVASHIPERAERRVAALHGLPAPVAAEAGAQLATQAAKPPRPAFLLEPAEAISVLAEVPDGPPVRFTWRRVTRRVARAEGPERIAPEWWRLIGGRATTLADGVDRAPEGGAPGGGAPDGRRQVADVPGAGSPGTGGDGEAGREEENDGAARARVAVPRPAWRIRDYYRVEDEHGGVYWMYRAGLYPSPEPVAPARATAGADVEGEARQGDAGQDDAAAAPWSLAPPTWYLQGVF